MQRQGELLIIKVKKIDYPRLWNTSKRKYLKRAKKDHLTLAEGEATGHLHQLDKGTLYIDRTMGFMYFKVAKKQVATLTHPEHQPLTFTEGLHKVITQREYEPEGARKVID